MLMGGFLWQWKSSNSWVCFLAVFFLGILCAELIVRHRNGQSMNPGIISTMAVSLLGVVIGFFAGYSYRGDKENRERYTYTDVLIVARHNDRKFTLQPARMQPFDTKPLCSSEDWQKDQKMSLFTFTPREDCWDVEAGGSYVFYMKDGKRITYPQETITDARY